MPTQNTIATEVVEFKADGIDSIIAKAREMGIVSEEAAKKAEDAIYGIGEASKRSAASIAGARSLLASSAPSLRKPDRFDNFIQDRFRMQKASPDLKRAADSHRMQMAPPDLKRAADAYRADLTKMSKDHGRSAFSTDRGSDDLAKQAREAARLADHLGKGSDGFAHRMRASMADTLGKTKEFTAIAARNGIGGLSAVKAATGGLPGAAGVVGGGGLAATWAKGFGGTLESGRMEREWELLGREVAGAMKPVTDAFTNGMRDLRKFLERLSPEGQNHLAAAGVLGAAGIGVSKATGGGFFPATLQAIAGLKGFDNLMQFYETAKFTKTAFQKEFLKSDISVSQDESDRFGYRKMKPEQLDQEDKTLDMLIEKHKEYTADAKNPFKSIGHHLDMMIGSTFKAFGYDMLGTGKTSYGEHFETGTELYKRRQEVANIKAGMTPEEEQNKNRRRVTPDNISFGELGSSADEATLSLMKVNMPATGEKSQEQKFTDMVLYLQQISTNTKPGILRALI